MGLPSPISLTDGRTTPGLTAIKGSSWIRSGNGWVSGAPLRHDRGWNAGSLDSHAGWLPAGEFWRVDTDERGFYWFH